MSATPQQAPAARKLILIVDDTPLNIGVISGALKDFYKTKVATSGEKALALAAAEEKPDLILLDVMMPGMDGYEVCSRLKADPSTREIPVIFLTGQTGAEDETRGLRPQTVFAGRGEGSRPQPHHASRGSRATRGAAPCTEQRTRNGAADSTLYPSPFRSSASRP